MPFQLMPDNLGGFFELSFTVVSKYVHGAGKVPSTTRDQKDASFWRSFLVFPYRSVGIQFIAPEGADICLEAGKKKRIIFILFQSFFCLQSEIFGLFIF